MAMRVVCLGSGAYAGLFGGLAGSQGAEVTMVARSDLSVLQARGLTFIDLQGQRHVVPVHAIPACAVPSVSPPDIVVVGWKAHDIIDAAFGQLVKPLLGDHTVAIFPQNGIGWFFPPMFDMDIAQFPSDPSGRLAALFPLSQAAGAVSYPAVSRTAPGVIAMEQGRLMPIGMCAPSPLQPTLDAFVELLIGAGMKVPILEPGLPMASEWWIKVTGFGSNALGALTGMSMSQVATNEMTAPLLQASMEEAYALGERLGLTMRVPLDKRLGALANMGEHKSSTLVDVENATPLELHPTLGALLAMADEAAVSCRVNRHLFQLLCVADAYLRGDKFIPPQVLLA